VFETRADARESEAVRAMAQADRYDYLPVNRSGPIVVATVGEVPLTRDWLVTRDTPVSDLLASIADFERTASFFLGG
jgi:hypothetical protein